MENHDQSKKKKKKLATEWTEGQGEVKGETPVLLALGPVSQILAGHCGWLTAGFVEVSGLWQVRFL